MPPKTKRVSFGNSQTVLFSPESQACVNIATRAPHHASPPKPYPPPHQMVRKPLGEVTNMMQQLQITPNRAFGQPLTYGSKLNVQPQAAYPIQSSPSSVMQAQQQMNQHQQQRAQLSPASPISSIRSITSVSPRIIKGKGPSSAVTSVALFGMPRAGSAWLFNALRHILRLEGQEVRADWDNGIASRYGGGSLPTALRRLREIGMSSLIKSLQCTPETLACTERSFVCVRDIRQAVYSEMAKRNTLSAPPQEWVNRAQSFSRMCLAAEVAGRAVPGHMFRMAYEELIRNPVAMLAQVAGHLGHPKLPLEDAESGVELLSRTVDIDADRPLEGIEGIRAIEEDPECRKWLQMYGYLLSSDSTVKTKHWWEE